MQKYRVEINDEGTIRWFKFGTNQLHRLDGPALEGTDGTKGWYQNDQSHRLDGPAFIKPGGCESWWQNNLRHRLDGPAIEWNNGDGWWFIEGKRYTEEDFHKEIARRNNTTCDNRIIEIDGVEYRLKKV